ncbi:MAG: IPT/TIG domain-containing protein [Acidobacteria bacterium]|nr:IPT/TIG domain-containing protein [Acidobacteriota bacterium]
MNRPSLATRIHPPRIMRWMTLCLLTILCSLAFISPTPTVSAQSGYEGDVTPRPTGKNGAINPSDYAQIGRFATNVDKVNEGSELQRADCAPRATLGDGRIGIADLVQAMRYASGLDPLTAAGGPTAAVAAAKPALSQPEAAREVRVGTATFTSTTVTIPIELEAQGNENALGFTLAFDANLLSNPVAVLGTDAAAALLLLNPNEVGSGRLGVGFALPPGQKFAAGINQILRVTFNFGTADYGKPTPIGFASSPVALEISDEMGNLLEQRIFTGKQVIIAYPVPKITALNPDFAFAGDPMPFTLGVIGMNFVNGSVVRWNGADLNTTFQSSTLLTATVPASLIGTAGTADITVFNTILNPSPGGGTSNTLKFRIDNPVPSLTGLGISMIDAGGAGGMFEVTGDKFVNSSVVYWKDRAMPTTFISRTRLKVTYTAADIFCAGIIRVTVVNPTPGGGTSGALSFSIKPTITSLNPPSAVVGGSTFTLTINGNGFCSGAKVFVNGVARSSVIVNPNQITTTINASELDAVKTLQISVMSDGVVSSPTPLPIICPPQAKVTLASALDFGTATPARAPIPNRTARTFMVENTGCETLSLNFAIRRTGEDVTSGKITNTDDSGTFMLFNTTDGANTEIRSGATISIPGGKTWTFRLDFDPKIPAPAGKTSNLAASQVIPDVITSTFSILQGATTLKTATLTGRVESNARLINPLVPRLAPLVVFNKTGSNEFTVEASGYDANSDIYLLAYQFYDQAGNRIGQAPNFDLDLRQAGLLKGQSFTLLKKFTANDSGLNAYQVQVFFYDREDYAVAASGPIGTGQGRILNATSVSAASYSAEAVASDGIVSVFSENFGSQTVTAQTSPLPNELGNVRVYVTDANQVERLASLFFVSPTQINYLIPEGTVPGKTRVVIVNKGEVVSEGTMQVAAMAPALFTANADGKGAPAAYAVRVKRDNSQSTEPVAQYDAVQKKFMPAPINIGPAEEQVFLVLFGTGIRHYSAMNRVSARIAGVDAEVQYAGPQGQYYGLDQVNLRIPRSALVSGEVDLLLTIDGKTANPVRIHVR